jgi:hypothetical protein
MSFTRAETSIGVRGARSHRSFRISAPYISTRTNYKIKFFKINCLHSKLKIKPPFKILNYNPLSAIGRIDSHFFKIPTFRHLIIIQNSHISIK